MDNKKNKTDPDKQWIISDLEQAVETLHSNAERIAALEKSLHESEWYLGEAKSRNQRLEDELREKDHFIRKLESEVYQLRSQPAGPAILPEVKEKLLHLEPVPPKNPVK